MPDSGKQSTVTTVFLSFSLLGFAALWFSPFVVSVVTALSGLAVLFYLPKSFPRYNRIILLSSVLLLLILFVDFVFHLGEKTTSAKFLLMLGLVFILQGHSYFFERASRQKLSYYFIVIAAIVACINVIAVAGYLSDKSYFDQMLLQSKSIPIPNMHHIHFGIINAITILGIVGQLVGDKVDKKMNILLWVFGIICLLSFHILSSRTGLLAFYAGSFITLVIYVIQHNAYKILLFGMLGLTSLAVIGYSLSSSLKNKVANSMEDINSWGKGDEINHKSMAMRIEAYKMSVAVLIENPLGVGAAAQDQILQEMYEKKNTLLYKENRVGPHNQLLEFGVKYGWIGIIGIFVFYLGWLRLLPNTSAFFWGVVVVFLVSVQFESLFERQASIYFSMTLLPLFYHLFRNQQLIEQ